MNRLLLLALLTLFAGSSLFAQTSYTFVSYNVENLFDLDGEAVFEDYTTLDKDGNSQYSPEDVYNKISNIVSVLKKYNDGKGPDVVAFAELESDFTPSHRNVETKKFLEKWANTTFKKMLLEDLNEEIQDIPSEFLLLKALNDEGLTGYDFVIGYSEITNKGPINVQKNAVFSILPINRDKSRLIPVKGARPIVEAWLDVNGSPLVVFANHWKSGAGSTKMEVIRVGNAESLQARLSELRKAHPDLDFILAGDFNESYNQHLLMKDAPVIALRDVLKVGGNEMSIAENTSDSLYNLWYEFSYDKRGSEAYRGELGTLMNIIIPSAMYNETGVFYKDNSFSVGAFAGMNVYDFAFIPKRWDSYGYGSGYSDHLPISMQFSVTDSKKKGKLTLVEPIGKESVKDAKKIPIDFSVPKKGEYFVLSEFDVSDLAKTEYYNQFIYCELELNSKNEVVLGDKNYKVYASSKMIKEKLDQMREANNGKVKFFGRNTLYKSIWEFIIESENHIVD